MADILNNLNSANYITVKVTDDPITNGNNLLEAYRRAKTTTPNNSALSSSNRLSIILPPATYDLGTQTLILDTQFIDVIGSTTNRANQLIRSFKTGDTDTVINHTANDIRLINLTIQVSGGASCYKTNSNNHTNAYIENINFLAIGTSQFSTHSGEIIGGKFVNCEARQNGFGWGRNSRAVGYFENCIGSFAGNFGHADGTFINCSGISPSFGGSAGRANGYFKNCIGGYGAFGGDFGVASGRFEDCRGGIFSFGDFEANGIYINCEGADFSFAAFGFANGEFINCKGGAYSFGNSNVISSGRFTNCIGGLGSFRIN